MQGAFTRGQHVHMVGIEREERAAILEQDTGVVRNNSRAKGSKQTLDLGDGVAIGINCAEVDGVTGFMGRRFRGPIGVVVGPEAADVFVAEERLPSMLEKAGSVISALRTA